MKFLRLVVVLCFTIVAVSPCVARVLDQQSINGLFDQYASVINSRSPDKIKTFLTYYVDPEANFYINKIKINAKTQKEENISSKLNRDEYIKYITHVATDPIAYSFVLELISTQIAPDNLTATVAMHIDEMAVVSQKDIVNVNEKHKIKAVVSTNCNFAIATVGTNPVFTSANCIEKVVFG